MVKTWNCLIFVCICHHRFSRMKVRHNSDHLRSSITSPSWSQVTSKFCRKLTNYPITQTHWGALLVNNRAGLRCWIKGANHNFVMIPAHHEHYTHPAQQRCWSRASDLKQVQGFHHFSKLPGGVHEQMLTVRLNNFRFSLIFTDFAVVVQLPGQITVLTSPGLNPWVTNGLTHTSRPGLNSPRNHLIIAQGRPTIWIIWPEPSNLFGFKGDQ